MCVIDTKGWKGNEKDMHDTVYSEGGPLKKGHIGRLGTATCLVLCHVPKRRSWKGHLHPSSLP